ncbi:hypothetical protein B7P43_G00338 [Cryptotermes secundus]|uniref:Uncharacterized protein n=1 Tax=Cryptotermes secundus TaxID=105785 RepID=A0A2J7QVH7_9NEOP|nr:uncharacterized protein LOC111865131 [Cryptotermes secundus]PNF32590.1 hypothetical protein B7P43_G00338 [Cryptotermes secundus]
MTAQSEERNVQMRVLTCSGLCALAILGGLFVLVEAGLKVEGNVCGQRKCEPKEYCRENDKICQPCRDVCERTSNNYQQTTCNSQCQDYIHDKWYVMRQEEAAGDDVRSEVARLTVLVILTLVISMLVLLVLIGTLTLFFCDRKRKNKQSPVYIQSNGTNNGKVSYKTEPLKLDMPATVPPPSTTTATAPAAAPVTPATTSTPLSTRPRYPKEDPTLEYGAYDNPALTPSPVFENNPPETTPVSRRQESSF